MKPKHRHSLRDGFTAYGALSPVSMTSESPSSRGSSPQNLAPAQGCQDHTLLPYAFMLLVWRHTRVHRIPLPTLVTIAKRPSHRRRDEQENHDFMKFGRRIFFTRRLDKAPCFGFTKIDLPVGQPGCRAAQLTLNHRVPTNRSGSALARQRGSEVAARTIHGLQLFAAKEDHSGRKAAAS